MIITLIAAYDRRGAIGREGRLPWNIPEDMRRFRQLTDGHPVVVGRATWESIGRPLSGRTLIVVTSRPLSPPAGVTVAHSIDDAIIRGEESGTDELFIAGGESIYRQTMDRADRLLLTEIDADFGGDRYFPPIDEGRFRLVSREEFPNTPPLRFLDYRRVDP